MTQTPHPFILEVMQIKIMAEKVHAICYFETAGHVYFFYRITHVLNKENVKRNVTNLLPFHGLIS